MVDLPEVQREAMRRWTTGVTIVTSQLGDMRHGMTVNSFTSLSLHPARTGITLADNSRTCQLVKKSGFYGVTILAEEQAELADRFAGKSGQESDRFAGLKTFEIEGHAPFIQGGLAYLECKVLLQYPLGESTLFIGEVIAVRVAEPGNPLIYLNRTYHRLQV
jgi:flavin reductase (DIM6/NTAB) family NADH-FMN oxidoreductase RutF